MSICSAKEKNLHFGLTVIICKSRAEPVDSDGVDNMVDTVVTLRQSLQKNTQKTHKYITILSKGFIYAPPIKVQHLFNKNQC